MKFCPRCGGLMIPVGQQKGKIMLKCTKCGYVEALEGGKQLTDYTIRERTPREAHTITTLKVSEAKKRPPKSLEEWEQEREEYREVLLEQLQEELEGGEE